MMVIQARDERRARYLITVDFVCGENVVPFNRNSCSGALARSLIVTLREGGVLVGYDRFSSSRYVWLIQGEK